MGFCREFFKKTSESFERLIVDVIYDRKTEGLGVCLLRLLLRGLSLIFTLIVQIRLLLYKNGLFKAQPLGCLVIVVGNLTVGGTGKTPVVEQLAKALTRKGRKVAILSRGYKSKGISLGRRALNWLIHAPASPPKVVSDGKTIFLNSEYAGDEPYMLAKNLQDVVVIVDKDRVKAGRYAIRHFGADTLILDDGFQYLSLKGVLNLVLVDKTNPFGNGKLLPCGILREPLSRLKDASYVLLTKSDGVRDLPLEAIIRKHNQDAQLIECRYKPKCLNEIGGEMILTLSELAGLKVASLVGIAVPESFEQFLVEKGAKIVYSKWFMDHHRFDKADLREFFQAAVDAGAELVLTTEKDAVRIEENFQSQLPFYYLKLEVEILLGKNLEDTVSRICFPKSVL